MESLAAVAEPVSLTFRQRVIPKSSEGARGKSFPPHSSLLLRRLGLDQRFDAQLALLDLDVGGFAFFQAAFED